MACPDREEAAAAQEVSVNGPVWAPVGPAGYGSADLPRPPDWSLKNLTAAPLFLSKHSAMLLDLDNANQQPELRRQDTFK